MKEGTRGKRKQNCESKDVEERNESREMAGRRANMDDFSCREGKKLSRLLNMEKRKDQDKSTNREEERSEGKGKGSEGKRKKRH